MEYVPSALLTLYATLSVEMLEEIIILLCIQASMV